MDPLIGQITPFGFNFAPRDWSFCDGQLLAISSNTALFSLLGTIYGGDGRTTFALPDLRGRMPMHEGAGPGLSTRVLGQSGGQQSVTLSTSQMPVHTHTISVSVTSEAADTDAANGNTLATGITPSAGPVPERAANLYKTGATTNGALANVSAANQGGSQAHENMPPFLVINYCIALAGIYPSRS